MARSSRGPAAEFRCRISRPGRAGGFCLQQPDLFLSLVHGHGTSSNREADGEAQTVAGLARLMLGVMRSRRCARNLISGIPYGERNTLFALGLGISGMSGAEQQKILLKRCN